jgi:site-specific recombinase XerD
MQDSIKTQGSIVEVELQDRLDFWVESFLFDRKAQNMAAGTLTYYQVKLRCFTSYCDTRHIDRIGQITADELRRFLSHLEETGHNPGGRHALYRAIKTFMLWYESEEEPESWKNPIRKVKPPIVPTEPLDPVPLDDIKAMEDTCDKSFFGCRDRVILLALLDTGARASEFIQIDLVDVDLITGAVLIRQGKGRKPRTVYLGAKSKKAIRQYLKFRTDNTPALFVTEAAKRRLSYMGLRSVILRRARLAGLEPYGLHAFRRQFALTMLRAGVDLATLARLMGHNNLVVLMRYLKQLPIDLQKAHMRAGPVDNADL